MRKELDRHYKAKL